MSDCIMTDEEGTRYSFENIKTQGWLDGHASGLDAAVGWVKERAVDLFRAGKDEAATSMRRLAEEMDRDLRSGMEQRARSHREEFPAIVGYADEDDEADEGRAR